MRQQRGDYVGRAGTARVSSDRTTFDITFATNTDQLPREGSETFYLYVSPDGTLPSTTPPASSYRGTGTIIDGTVSSSLSSVYWQDDSTLQVGQIATMVVEFDSRPTGPVVVTIYEGDVEGNPHDYVRGFTLDAGEAVQQGGKYVLTHDWPTIYVADEAGQRPHPEYYLKATHGDAEVSNRANIDDWLFVTPTSDTTPPPVTPPVTPPVMPPSEGPIDPVTYQTDLDWGQDDASLGKNIGVKWDRFLLEREGDLTVLGVGDIDWEFSAGLEVDFGFSAGTYDLDYDLIVEPTISVADMLANKKYYFSTDDWRIDGTPSLSFEGLSLQALARLGLGFSIDAGRIHFETGAWTTLDLLAQEVELGPLGFSFNPPEIEQSGESSAPLQDSGLREVRATGESADPLFTVNLDLDYVAAQLAGIPFDFLDYNFGPVEVTLLDIDLSANLLLYQEVSFINPRVTVDLITSGGEYSGVLGDGFSFDDADGSVTARYALEGTIASRFGIGGLGSFDVELLSGSTSTLGIDFSAGFEFSQELYRGGTHWFSSTEKQFDIEVGSFTDIYDFDFPDLTTPTEPPSPPPPPVSNSLPKIAGPVSFKVVEGSTSVGTVRASDEDGTLQGWQLSGADSAHFSVSNGGVIRFKAPPDYENPADQGGDNIYNFVVHVSDNVGGSASSRVGVAVSNDPADDPVPVITMKRLTVDEGETVRLTRQMLDAQAPDTPNEQIIFHIRREENGDFYLRGRYTDKFSLADIIKRQVEFRHDGSDGSDAAPAFEVALSTPGGASGYSAGEVIFTPVNDNPRARPDYASTTAGQSVNINVLQNDRDVDSASLRVSEVGSAAKGDVILANGQLRYTPRGSSSGEDTFTYKVSDGQGGEGEGFVTVQITPTPTPNRPPMAIADTAETRAGATIEIAVLNNDSDPDGDSDTLSLEAVGQPSNGQSRIDGSKVSYTPNPGYTGADAFSYTVEDSYGNQVQGRVTVQVLPAAPPPTGFMPVPVPGAGPMRIDTAIPLAQDALSAASAAEVVALANGDMITVWSANGEDGRHIYAQRLSPVGEDVGANFRVSASSQALGREIDPQVAALANGDFAVAWLDRTAADAGIYAQIFSGAGAKRGEQILVASDSANTLTSPSIVPASDGGFVVHWDAGAATAATYGRRFDTAGKGEQPFTVVEASSENRENPEAVSLAGGGYVIAWADRDEDNVFFSIHDAAGRMTAPALAFSRDSAGNSRHINIELNALSNGGFVVTALFINPDNTQSLAGRIFDSSGEATDFAFPLTDFQDAVSVVHRGDAVSVTELADGSLLVVAVTNRGILAQQYDASGQPLGAVTMLLSDAEFEAFRSDANGASLYDTSDKSRPYRQIADNENGFFSVSVVARPNGFFLVFDTLDFKRDENGDAISGTGTGRVIQSQFFHTGPNQEPTITRIDDLSIDEDRATPLIIPVLLHSTDADGDRLSLVPGQARVSEEQGTVVVTADGQLSYTPAANFNGVAEIDYSITDGEAEVSGTARVVVNPVMDAPVARAEPTLPVTRALAGEKLFLDTVAVLFSDADGGTLQYSIVAGTLPSGIVLDGATGALRGASDSLGRHQVTIQATDPEGASARKDLVVDVESPLQLFLTGGAVADNLLIGSSSTCRLTAAQATIST